MATPALQSEDIAWAIAEHLRGNLEARLAIVQADRNGQGRMALTLPAPVSIDMGFDELALGLLPADFPRVSIIAAPVSPDRPRLGDQRLAEAVHTALVEWLVFVPSRADTEPQVIKSESVVLSWRYGEAVLGVLRDAPHFGGFEMGSIIPQVDEGQPTALRSNKNQGKEITGFLAGGTAQLVLTGRYTA